MGGLHTLIHVCRLTFPGNTAFLRVRLGSSLLPPPRSSQPPGAAFPLSQSPISPSPLRLASCRPLIAAEARLPPQAIVLNQPQRERRAAAGCFHVASTALPAVALPLLFLRGPFSPLLHKFSILFCLFAVGCLTLPPTCTALFRGVLTHLPAALPPHCHFLGTSYLLSEPHSSSLSVEPPPVGSRPWSPECGLGVSPHHRPV